MKPCIQDELQHKNIEVVSGKTNEHIDHVKHPLKIHQEAEDNIPGNSKKVGKSKGLIGKQNIPVPPQSKTYQ